MVAYLSISGSLLGLISRLLCKPNDNEGESALNNDSFLCCMGSLRVYSLWAASLHDKAGLQSNSLGCEQHFSCVNWN